MFCVSSNLSYRYTIDTRVFTVFTWFSSEWQQRHCRYICLCCHRHLHMSTLTYVDRHCQSTYFLLFQFLVGICGRMITHSASTSRLRMGSRVRIPSCSSGCCGHKRQAHKSYFKFNKFTLKLHLAILFFLWDLSLFK